MALSTDGPVRSASDSTMAAIHHPTYMLAGHGDVLGRVPLVRQEPFKVRHMLVNRPPPLLGQSLLGDIDQTPLPLHRLGFKLIRQSLRRVLVRRLTAHAPPLTVMVEVFDRVVGFLQENRLGIIGQRCPSLPLGSLVRPGRVSLTATSADFRALGNWPSPCPLIDSRHFFTSSSLFSALPPLPDPGSESP